MKAVIHVLGLGRYAVTDGGLGRELFYLEAALSGRDRIFWRNAATGISGVAQTLTAAVIAGLMSTGMGYDDAFIEGEDAVRRYLGDDGH